MKKYVLEFQDVSLAYKAERILDFSLTTYEGEYITILGADGSGKEALTHALLGDINCKCGEIRLCGAHYAPDGIPMAHIAKVFLISKCSNLIDSQSIAENMFYNHGGLRAFHPVNDRLIQSEADSILREFQVNLSARTPVGSLSQSMKCILEMIKWHIHDAKVLILDNALSTATAQEYRLFLQICKHIRASGTLVLHLMNRCIDIFSAADRCVLLSPKGRMVRTIYPEEFSMAALNEYIGRRERPLRSPLKPSTIGPEILRADDLSAGKCRGVSFVLHRGEAIGLYCEDSEQCDVLASALCGSQDYTGRILIEGKAVDIRSPMDARSCGIALLPSDPRKLYYPDLSPEENIVMRFMGRVRNRFGILQHGKIRALKQDAAQCLSNLDTSFSHTDSEEYMLSVVSSFMLYPYRILVLPHPSAINDVRKEDMICHLVNTAIARGSALIVFSTRRNELESMCSKILTLETL